MRTCGDLYRMNARRDAVTVDDVAAKTDEVLELLAGLQRRMDHPLRGTERRRAELWTAIRTAFRTTQSDRLTVATYRLLRDIAKNLNRTSVPVAEYGRAEGNFKLCLWVTIRLPTSMPNPRTPPKPRANVTFVEMDMSVLFPATFKYDLMCVRGMYLKYDHVSDRCATFVEPETPQPLRSDLNRSAQDEYVAKVRLMFETFPLKDGVDVATVPRFDAATCLGTEYDEPITVRLLELTKMEPPVWETLVLSEDDAYGTTLRSMVKEVAEHVVNLRQYMILGGVYYVNLYYQPPQPAELVGNYTTISTLVMPKELKDVDFHVEYVPAKIVNDGTKSNTEIIEEELKYQEQEFERFIGVKLTLPKHVVWMATPKVCQWDDVAVAWTSKDVHGVKYIEEKQFVEFKTGRFGLFAMAVFRYPNLPYQSWDIMPLKDATVLVRYTTALLAIDFIVDEDKVCVHRLKNSPNNTAGHIVGVYQPLPVLKRMMLECGIDIFPAHDTFLYVEGTCEKHWPTERHLYYCMARIYSIFNFSWSRWNMTAGRRGIVFQMREYYPDRVKQVPYSMVLVTPLRTSLIECSEVSSLYSDEPIENVKFCSDLNALVKSITSITTRTKLDGASDMMVHTIANLLIQTRIFSYS